MEANLKDVVTAALRQCRQQGSKADVLLLAYTACMLEEQGCWAPATPAGATQLPKLTLRTSRKLPEDALAAMADRLAQHVTAPEDPAAAATALLQIALECSYKQQQDKVEAEQAQQAAESSKLAGAVAYKKVNLQTAGLPEYQAVFEGVVDYVCTAMGVAARTTADAAARAQVSAAVESAFPLSGVAYFLTLPAQQRLRRMETLALLAWGICLHSALTGAPAAVQLLPPSAAAQLPQAERLLSAIQAAAAEAEAAMSYYNSSSSSASSSSGGSASSSNGLGAALFCCQAAVSLRQLSADLAGGIICCHALDEGVAAALEEASQLVSSSLNGVPKDAVFPLFESAGRLHLALTGELRLLLLRARIWEDTCTALTAAAESSTAAAPRVLGFKPRRVQGSSSNSLAGGSAAGAVTPASGVPVGLSAQEVAELPAYAEYVPPAVLAAQAGAAADGAAGDSSGELGVLALLGMCPSSLAASVAAGNAAATGGGGEAGRLLVGRLANPAVGAIRYGGTLYGFSSAEALWSFVESPALILDGVRQAVHNTPLLAHMLGLTSMAAAAADGSRSGSAGTGVRSQSSTSSTPSAGGAAVAVLSLRHLAALVAAAPVKVDVETQTPTHFTEGFIDVDYEWNEWALRRRIIALANLRTKATHSAQTALSHFRRDGDSQTWQPKAAAVQTAVHKGSTMPRKLRYVAGLRGAPERAKMRVVSLELDIGQTHQY